MQDTGTEFIRQQLLEEDIELQARRQKQDQQFAEIQAARKRYDESLDLAEYIAFWENLWANGGLLFRGSHWHFELATLYILAERYEDALTFVQMLKENTEYADRATTMEKNIKKLLKKKK